MKLHQGILPFQLVMSDNELEKVTAHAGLPMVVEALRAVISNMLYRRLRKALGYRSWHVVRRHVESLVLLFVAGGEHVDDIAVLRADAGLTRLLGFNPSSATQLKDFLYRFHQASDGRALSKKDDAVLSQKGEAHIRAEGPGLRLLAQLNNEVVRQVQYDHQCGRATIDVDATIIKAVKKTTLKAYEGTIGYQPQMAWWAEQSVWIADEFRDGNVPAAYEVRTFLMKAFSALPDSVRQRRLRGDSALYNEDALSWADENNIEFAVSADMSPSLREKIEALSEEAWKPYRTLKHGDDDNSLWEPEERQWAEVCDFIPEWKRNRRKNGEAFRYIAIRIRSRQRDLFEADIERWCHFAVVTNMKWEGQRLLRWHREKQGTVEHGHGVLKGELAGGTMPCGRFGSNATWWRLNVLAHNLLQLIKVRSLPAQMQPMRPKALRFRLFNIVGRIIEHAHRLILRISKSNPWAQDYARTRQSMLGLKRQARAKPVPAF